MTESNTPKVLVEFTPEEISWLADRLHEEWERTVVAKTVATSDEAQAKIEKHQKMERTLRNRILDKAHDQGFGNL